MDTKKLERIVLTILALLNAVLLVLLLRGQAQARSARQETLAQITRLLAENGVSVDSGVDLLAEGAAQCTVVRDLALEAQRMEGLLGKLSSEDLGGGIWYYRSDRGQIVMRGTGEMNILPTGDWEIGDKDVTKQLQTLMARAGLRLWAPDAGESPGQDRTLACCWKGLPVFNALLEFSFSGPRLELVTGFAVFDREGGRSERTPPDAVSVLVRVLEQRKADGILFSRLSGLQCGYRLSLSLNGEELLSPVWLLRTDTGDYYYDVSSGRILSTLS